MTGTDRRRVLARLAIPLAGLLATAFLTWLSMTHPYRYSRVITALFEWPGNKPFMDWAVTPTSLACWAKGVPVYLPNNCSPTFNYSPFMLLIPAPPGGPFWNIVFGFSIALAFFAMLGLLAPPRSRTEFAVRLLATLSPGVALGIERGNLDLILFVLLVAGSLVVARRGAVGLAGYGILVVAALAKFYPVAALFLSVRERPARFAAIWLVMLASATWLFLAFRAELAVILHNLPDGAEWTMEFKGRALPAGLAAGLARVAALRPHAAALEAGLRLLLVLLMAGAATLVWRTCTARGTSLPERQATLLPMVTAAAVTLFCFLAGQSYIYRGIYLLPVIPGLFVVARAAPPAIRRGIEASCILMAAVLWVPVIRWAATCLGIWDRPTIMRTLWVVHQLGWWWIATVLGTIMLAFLVNSAIGGAMLRVLPGPALARAGSVARR